MTCRRELGFVIVAALALAGCATRHQPPPGSGPPTAAADRRVVNLRALARLYGPLRWFHPSDEAAALDWDRFAIAAAHRVVGAASTDELAATLRELIAPIAPTVTIARAGQPLPSPPASPGGEAVPVSWQHRGAGLGSRSTVYASHRRHRTEARADDDAAFAAVGQSLDARPLRGRTIRMRLWIRSDGTAQGRAWLRVDRPNGDPDLLDNLADRPVTTGEWTEVTLGGQVAADAVRVVGGPLVSGTGAVWFDDVRVEVQDGPGRWSPVALDDGDFEADGLGPWRTSGDDHDVERVDGGRGGGHALRVQSREVEVAGDLFPEHAEPGAVADLDLGDGLVARVPLVVWSVDGHTLPAAAPAATRALAATLAAPADPDAPTLAAADVIVAWNVFRHFYPYLDVIGEAWPAVLDGALADALDDRDAGDRRDTLRRLLARSHDGHAWLTRPTGRASPPVTLAWIEERLVIAASADPQVQRGDVVVAVDGVPAAQALAEAEAFQAGSPQWQRVRALWSLGSGPEGSAARFTIERDGARTDVELKRAKTDVPPVFDRPALAELEPGIWYVDLGRASWDDISARLDDLAAARGVVFDMRDYPNRNHEVLRHVLRRPDDAMWMHVAHIVDPDPTRVTAWDHFTWHLTPAEPRITGAVVFITGPGAISYAESVMGYVQYEGLPIVGAATAGTNGNVRSVGLPGGEQMTFTGMKVTRHDGGQHHVRGVAPTIPAAPTIAGLRAGRDEVLERAVAEVRDRATVGR